MGFYCTPALIRAVSNGSEDGMSLEDGPTQPYWVVLTSRGGGSQVEPATVYCFTSAGVLRWARVLDDMIEASVTPSQNARLYVVSRHGGGNGIGSLWCLDSDGNSLWNINPAGEPLTFDANLGSTPAIAEDGTIFVADAIARVHAVRDRLPAHEDASVAATYTGFWGQNFFNHVTIGDNGTAYVASFAQGQPNGTNGVYGLKWDGLSSTLTAKWDHPVNMFDAYVYNSYIPFLNKYTEAVGFSTLGHLNGGPLIDKTGSGEHLWVGCQAGGTLDYTGRLFRVEEFTDPNPPYQGRMWATGATAKSVAGLDYGDQFDYFDAVPCIAQDAQGFSYRLITATEGTPKIASFYTSGPYEGRLCWEVTDFGVHNGHVCFDRPHITLDSDGTIYVGSSYLETGREDGLLLAVWGP